MAPRFRARRWRRKAAGQAFAVLAIPCVLSGCSGTSVEPQRELPAVVATVPSPVLLRTVPGARVDAPNEPLPKRAAIPQETPAPDDDDAAKAVSYPLHGATYHFLAQVFAEPSARAPVLGYMRRGARFDARFVKRRPDCPNGWHALPSGGFVCNGNGFAIGQTAPSLLAAPVPPRLDEALPYVYAHATRDEVPQYWRIPNADEERSALQHRDEEPDPASPGLVRMHMQRGFYVSLDRPDPASAGAFYRTVRGAYVRTRQLAGTQAMETRGALLGGALRLPLALVFAERARRFVRDPIRGALQETGVLPPFSTLPLAGEVSHRGARYFVSPTGVLVRADAVRMARTIPKPASVPAGAKLIQVSLSEQTLVAYENDHPVFATLISSGRSDHPTPTGLFRIESKHVSATMDDVTEDDAYSIEDVPWTMYFHEHLALHGAFWHRAFGRPHSRGCVNLAPADARWLFNWATPVLPASWHGVVASRITPGTFVHIVP